MILTYRFIVLTLKKNTSMQYTRTRRPSFNFLEMGINIGDILYSVDGEHACEVVDEKKVKFNNEIISLTRATRLMLDCDYNVAPGLLELQWEKIEGNL